MRLLRLLAWLLMLLALCYGIAQGALYWKLTQTTQYVARVIAPAYQLSYGSLTLGAWGQVEFADVHLHPRQFVEPIKIAKLSLKSQAWLPWLLGRFSSKQDRLPPDLMLEWQQVTLPLEDPLLGAVPSLAYTDAAVACASGQPFSPALWRALGHQQAQFDLLMTYRFEAANDSFNADLDLSMGGRSVADASIALASVTPDDVFSPSMLQTALAAASLSVQISPPFAEAYFAYCARETEQANLRYRQALVAVWERRLAELGLVSGAGVRDALTALSTEFVPLRLALRPAEPISFALLLKEADRPRLSQLGINVFLDGQRQQQLEFNSDLPALLGKVVPERVEHAKANTAEERSTPRRIRIVRRYEAVAVQDLAKHIGATVKIKPTGQPVRSGVLMEVGPNDVVLRQRAYGGSLSVFIETGDIEKIEVERLERRPLSRERSASQ